MGRPFGIPVHVSPTWFLIAAFITYFFAPFVAEQLPGIGSLRYVVAFAFAVLLYFSVFVHELSHSLVARAFGLPVRRITLYLLGGFSEIEREPETPGREFLVAVAGPVLSLMLAAGAFGVGQVLPPGTVASLLASELQWANLLVGVFNLLPGLPLDGGRILRAGVWRLTRNPGTGTVAAAWTGRGLGVLIFIAPLTAGAILGAEPSITAIIWCAVIGSFIWVGASQALRVSRLRDRLPTVQARRLARRAFSVPPDTPLSEALRRAEEAGAAGLVIVDPVGEPIALVNEAAVSATPESRRPWVDVASMSRRLEPGLILSADLSGRDLLSALRGTPASEYLVVDEAGDVYGVLATADVDRAFAAA